MFHQDIETYLEKVATHQNQIYEQAKKDCCVVVAGHEEGEGLREILDYLGLLPDQT